MTDPRSGADRLTVSVPASSANLGAGFDVLGLALSLPLQVSLDDRIGRPAEGRHPARQGFEVAGGVGRIFCDDRIPSGRGLGFSGAARVGAVALGLAQQAGIGPHELDAFIGEHRGEIHRIAAGLEGHGDNVGASVYGGLVVTSVDEAIPLPIVADVSVVVWVPSHTTSTDASRSVLPVSIPVADAVVNIGAATRMVGALVSGDRGVFNGATVDRIHQAVRLAASPASARVLAEFEANGALCAWLSGSGPTVAAFVDRGAGARLSSAIADDVVGDGRLITLDIDRIGVRAN